MPFHRARPTASCSNPSTCRRAPARWACWPATSGSELRVYVDSSALLKRVFAEAESRALSSALRAYAEAGAALAASSLAWVEVSRAVRAFADEEPDVDVDALVDVALSGVLEKPISPEVVAVARRLDPAVLRSLDAIHLASAVLLDVDVIVAYDQRLAEAAAAHRIKVLSPTG